MNFLLPVAGVKPIPIRLGGALSHLTRCSIIEWCWNPHTVYLIPAGTCYILSTAQKTVFGLYIIPENILLQLIENGFNLGDFRKMKRYDQKTYKLPPPTPAQVPAERNKRHLEEQPGPSLDHFEIVSAIEQQETPIDLTMPRLKKKVKRATGFKVIKPLDLSVHNY
ncbi:uncharacterized protein TNCV_4693741 [Trichonephila clavipes]|uniref:Uncharacterized protein n=1 Tax=Trichonephila clavipes TaxID=2585209 RepID=A0A8X7BHJ6_TRICX|nr:uncharacterized protein TNCV_4693741 [Trichonephila clavipes]